jgi:hypothetical protein
MVTSLAPRANTERAWSFRDDNAQHYPGDIPAAQKVNTLTLTWKASRHAPSAEVGP